VSDDLKVRSNSAGVRMGTLTKLLLKTKRHSQVPCPACGAQACGVIDSRRSGNRVRRIRQCSECGGKWTTMEISVDELLRADVAVRVGEIIHHLREFADELEEFHLRPPA
jgi:predicted RNA-binding Zn-ribbon protein involved in translation (DUF1610 family)